ncbi:hypothetical protein [Tsukamurella sp. PLM1]|uniref:hypothetical protein n=1 Tax=Tsukamurella sp. PLM1 TaxID=2929795 RepID=UPI0020BF42A1|nr:hypothetical protein [Tsukamurella sp. PLM1]
MPLDQIAIADAVRGTRWHEVSVVPSTGSTNADLADGVRAGDAPGASSSPTSRPPAGAVT